MINGTEGEVAWSRLMSCLPAKASTGFSKVRKVRWISHPELQSRSSLAPSRRTESHSYAPLSLLCFSPFPHRTTSHRPSSPSFTRTLSSSLSRPILDTNITPPYHTTPAELKNSPIFPPPPVINNPPPAASSSWTSSLFLYLERTPQRETEAFFGSEYECEYEWSEDEAWEGFESVCE
jgi:hypothetical protein